MRILRQPRAVEGGPAGSRQQAAMAKRLLAALAAMLTFAAVLAVVPLTTAEPAEAHPKYKTVRTCIVDPPINHCTTKRVSVPHTHTCPAGTTGTYPNCTRPDTPAEAENKKTKPPPCPAGQHRHGTDPCHANHETKKKTKTETETTPEDTTPEDTTPEDTTPEDTTPEDTTPRRNTPAAGTRENRAETTAKPKTCPPKQAGQRRPRPPATHDHGGTVDCHLVGNTHCPPGHTEIGGHGGRCRDDRGRCPSRYRYDASRDLCELSGAVKFTESAMGLNLAVSGEVICTFTGGGVASRVVNKILDGVSEAAKKVAKVTFETTIEHPCDQIWDDLEDWVESERSERVPDTVPSGTTPREGALLRRDRSRTASLSPRTTLSRKQRPSRSCRLQKCCGVSRMPQPRKRPACTRSTWTCSCAE